MNYPDAFAQAVQSAAWAYVWHDPVATLVTTFCWILGASAAGAGFVGAAWLVFRFVPDPNNPRQGGDEDAA